MTLATLVLTLNAHGQEKLPDFRKEVVSAVVWGEDNGAGTVSSSIRDPVTGNSIHKLNHGGIEVSSRAGFERVASEKAGELLNFTITIANNTESEISVRQGIASVDGHLTPPLSVVLSKKGLSKKERKKVWDLASMGCFSGGFLPNEFYWAPNKSSKDLSVSPKGTLTVSFVAKDPRYYSVLCTDAGCYPKGTMRFSVTVNTTDFVFVWPGDSMVSCGK
jgi:hypothetical protein